MVVFVCANMRWYPYKLNVKVALSSISHVTLNAVHNFHNIAICLKELSVEVEVHFESQKIITEPTLRILLQGVYLPNSFV